MCLSVLFYIIYQKNEKLVQTFNLWVNVIYVIGQCLLVYVETSLSSPHLLKISTLLKV